MNISLSGAVERYLRACKTGDWIFDEAYKFEFANYIKENVHWDVQSDDKVLEILQNSQKLRYTGGDIGVQFIIKSGKEKISEFIQIQDVKLFRKLISNKIENIDWSSKSMSFTGLSAWISSLFPEKLYPVPQKGFDRTIKYLFGLRDEKFPKVGLKYILHCQPYLHQTKEFLSQYPIEELCLKEWNKYYKEYLELNIPLKKELSLIDWVWLAQDFHIFVFQNILDLYPIEDKNFSVAPDFEPTAIEGKSVLAKHMRYERNSSFIKSIKEKALKDNKMLNCRICNFSFLEKYGEIGKGFIEAHHINPLSESEGKRVTKEKDIILVCSNCHRMLHRGNPNLSVEELIELIRNTKSHT